MLIIVAVFAATLPLLIPRALGYQVLGVSSASMEPAIPIDSVVYVRTANPDDITADAVVAFMDEGTPVVHRVVSNDHDARELTTKGDASSNEDADPVSYDSLLGEVALRVPYLGLSLALFESTVGKVYLGLTLACGVMLNLLADRMRKRRALAAAQGGLGGEGTVGGARPSRGGEWVRAVLMCVLALVFCGTGGVVLSVQHQDQVASERLAAAAERYTSKIGAVVEGVTVAPIKVDFDALRAANPDVVGWIYCEGTIINYPVVQGKSNDEYLYHDYLGDYSVRGSIFVEAENRPGFTDAETIIYGHHMSSGTMFAALENWADQEFYDEHPVMWLLTPTQDYQIVLVSGHHSSARSDIYNVRHDHDKAFEQYLTDMKAQSEFVPSQDVVYSPDQNYVMLSTCSFIFEDARFVLHGVLVPVA